MQLVATGATDFDEATGKAVAKHSDLGALRPYSSQEGDRQLSFLGPRDTTSISSSSARAKNPNALPENAMPLGKPPSNCRLDVVMGTEMSYQVVLVDPTNNDVQQPISIQQFGKLVRLFVEPIVSVACGRVLRRMSNMLCPASHRGRLSLHVLTSGELRLYWAQDGSSEVEEIVTINPGSAAKQRATKLEDVGPALAPF